MLSVAMMFHRAGSGGGHDLQSPLMAVPRRRSPSEGTGCRTPKPRGRATPPWSALVVTGRTGGGIEERVVGDFVCMEPPLPVEFGVNSAAAPSTGVRAPGYKPACGSAWVLLAEGRPRRLEITGFVT